MAIRPTASYSQPLYDFSLYKACEFVWSLPYWRCLLKLNERANAYILFTTWGYVNHQTIQNVTIYIPTHITGGLAKLSALDRFQLQFDAKQGYKFRYKVKENYCSISPRCQAWAACAQCLARCCPYKHSPPTSATRRILLVGAQRVLANGSGGSDGWW